ncbi:MAG: TadE/TadG family type IV pilus assembly protein [Candidatus Limnocylindrales bacterium]
MSRARDCLGRLRREERSRGQSLVEFAVLVPVFMLILIGMLEFGLMFNHNLTLQYATREGARVGSALANGLDSSGAQAVFCPAPAGANDPDCYIMAAVQRILESNGSPIRMANIGQVRIYSADAAGNQIGSTVDVWTYSPGGGPVVDGRALDFARSGSNGWPAGSRNNGVNPDSIGVSISYTYTYQTPLASVMRLFGGPAAATQAMTDKTVMALNPTQ